MAATGPGTAGVLSAGAFNGTQGSGTVQTVTVPATAVEDALMAAGCTPALAAPGCVPLVKKWIRTRRAVLFRLSCRVVQMSFYDGQSVAFGQDGATATYQDPSGRRAALPAGVALQGGPDLDATLATARLGLASDDVARRSRYARDIVGQLLTGTTGAPQSGAQGGSPAGALAR